MFKHLFMIFALILAFAFPAQAGSKLWGKGHQLQVINYRVDLSKSDLVPGTANGAVGAHVLGNLPDDFIILGVTVNPVLGLTGGGSIVVGEDGGGDADGYCADLDGVTIDVAVTCSGALIWSEPATPNEIGTPLAYKVAAAKDGFTYTIASTPYTEGILEFIIVGYQGE